MYLEALKTKLSCKFHQFFCTVSSAWNGPICGQFTGGACVCVYVCPCTYAAFVFFLSFVFLHRGADAPSKFPSYFLTYTSPSALVPICWDDCTICWRRQTFCQSFCSLKKRKSENSNILRKCFLLFLYVYVLCTAANCITEMKIKGCFLASLFVVLFTWFFLEFTDVLS